MNAMIALIIIPLLVNAVQLSHKGQAWENIGTEDGIILCGGHEEGNTAERFDRQLGNPDAPDAVYMFALGQDSTVEISTCGSSYDTILRVFDIDGQEEICACDDCGDCGLQTVLECELTPGPYLIVVDGFGSNTTNNQGPFVLDVHCPPTFLPCGGSDSGYTNYLPNVVGNEAGDALYYVQLPQATTITVNTCGSQFDTWLRVYDFTFTEGSDEVTLGTELCSCDDCGDCGVQTVLNCDLESGYYAIIVDGFSNSTGQYSLNLSCPRGNIGCGGTEAGFTTDVENVIGDTGGDVLYDMSVTSIYDVTVDSCGSDYDTWLRIMSADLETEICGCDDCGDCGAQTVLDCQLMAGDYVVAVSGFSSSEGGFTITQSCAMPVVGCDASYSGSTVGAASVVGGDAGDNLYSLDIASTTYMVIDTCGSSFDTWVRIIHDSVDGNVACSCDDCGACGLQSVLACTLLPGHYVVSIDGFNVAEGDYVFTTSCTTDPFAQ